MHPFDIALSLLIAAGAGTGLVFMGVRIQWRLRKARPSRQQIEPVETAPAPSHPAPELAPEAIERAPEAAEAEEAATASQVAEKPVPVLEAPRAPVRIGLGLRKTRENFLARIRAALTGSAKLDEIYEGLEEALIAADVGVEASMKIASALRTKLRNNNDPDALRDA